MSGEHPTGDDSQSPTRLLEINRACDRFEAAWRAGRRPAAEDHLGEATGPSRSALLGELLATELECRRSLGERPTPAEYRARFPDDVALVEAALARAGLASPPPATDAGRELLFGLLALQNHFVDRDALLAAFAAWVVDKSRPMGGLLLERGAIDAPRHALLEALVGEHLKRHDGDPGRSLAAMVVGGSTRETLKRVGDPDLDASLARVGQTESFVGDDATAAYAIGTSTADGRRFRVLRPHAKGGLGAVFVALDGELNREVALKEILDHHADDSSSRARFLLEAEITGGLEHPGIVPVYGLGTYGDGRPYYAMRFIRGDSLKDAIAAYHAAPAPGRDPGARSLELRKLLRRFLDVCNAIDYAHSRGVLHRDIKPANVIVGKYGETLVVDWGLAKSTGHRDPDAPGDERTLRPSSASGGGLETLPGSVLGTPAYMSPEQAAGELEKLGPRSDVYGLGATLFFLLTGRPPVSANGLEATLRAVREGDVTRPRSLDPTIDRALEALCLKALTRRPEDRYPTARALAEDAERWLADEPVTAYREPPSRRARRWAKRHRTAVTGATVALLVGFAGLALVATVQAQANRALRKANGETLAAQHATEAALVETTGAKKATEAALVQSEESRKQAEAVSTFLVEAFRSPDPSQDGRTIKVVDILDRAAEKLEKEFTGSPATKGAMLDALGQTYFGLGLLDRAVETDNKALAVRTSEFGADHPDTLDSRNDLAQAYLAAGKPTEAIALEETTLKLRETKLGVDHRDTLDSRADLAEAYHAAGRTAEALAMQETTLRLCEAKLGGDDPDTLTNRNNLASYLKEAGRTAEALAMQETTLRLCEAKLGADHPGTLTTRSNLASVYFDTGRTAEALTLFEVALKQLEAKLGADHPDTLASRGNLAAAYRAAGRVDEAIRLGEATLKLREAKLGADHPGTLTTRSNLASAYHAAGRTAEAIAMFKVALKLREAKLGADHPDTLTSRNSLAITYYAAGRTAEAIAMHEVTLKLREAKLGADHPHTHASRNNLALAYESLGRWNDATGLRLIWLTYRRKTNPPDSSVLGGDLAILALDLMKQEKWSEAEPVLRECLVIRLKARPDDWSRFNTAGQLGESLLGQGRFAEAEPLVLEGYQEMKAREAKIPPAGRPRLPEAAERVVRLYETWGKPEKGAEWKARLGLADLPANVFAPGP